MTVLFRPERLGILLFCMLLLVPPAWSQTDSNPDKPTPTQPLTESQVQENDAALDRIQVLRSELAELAGKVDRAEGVEKAAFEKRLNNRWLELLSVAADFAQTVAEQADSNYDVNRYRPDVERLLDKLPGEVRNNLGQTHLTLEDVPDANKPAEEQLIHDAKLMQLTRENDRLYQALLTALQLAEKFGVPTAVERPALQEMLLARAEAQSVYLEFSIEDAESLRFQAGSLPDDEKLQKRLTVVENRVDLIATSLAKTVHMMDALDMETSRFREQVVKATGEISSEALDTQVIGGIVADWFRSAGTWIQNKAPSLLVKVFTFLLIFYLFVLLARLARRLLSRALDSSRLQVSRLLRRIAVSTTQNAIMIRRILVFPAGPVRSSRG